MTKLDPHLRGHLRLLRAGAPRAAGEGADSAQAESLEVIVRFTGALADLTAIGFRPITFREPGVEDQHIVPGSIPVSLLADLAAIDHVVSISYPEQLRPLLDYSLPEIRADVLHTASPSRKGDGVVIGIIDSGIDWRHRDFIGFDERSSRVLALWDQLLTPAAGETPGPGTLGVVYDQGEMDRAVRGTLRIRSSDTGTVKDKEDERSKGHGTHVAGIAAGSGAAATCCRGPNTYIGVAPRASLVIVRSDFQEHRLIAGIDFILSQVEVGGPAAGQPVVINMSLGGTVGPHDGTQDIEQHINNVVLAKPGRAIVVAAGNSGDVKTEPCHVAATVAAATAGGTGRAEVEFVTADQIRGSAFVDVWYARSGRLNATLTCPDGTVIGPANHGLDVGPVAANPGADGDRQAMTLLDSTINGLQGRDNNLRLRVVKPKKGSVPAGSWKLTLENPDATPVPFHAWTSPPELVNFLPPADPPDDKIRASASSTVEFPGTAAEAITVANHQARTGCCNCWPSDDIEPSSSRGPVVRTAAVNHKPNIAAPGLSITAAAADAANLPGNCCDCCPESCCVLYVDLTGTSMSAPHVTGAIALMLEENHGLTKAQILQHLSSSTRPAPAPGDKNTWGAGKLNALGAVEAVRAAGGGGGGGGGGPAPGPVQPRLGGPAGLGVVQDDHAGTHRQNPLPGGFVELRGRLAALPDGERLAAVASRHFSEIRRLINTNRRVAVMWHRARGPALLHRMLLASESHRCCVTIGQRERRYLERLVDQLDLAGSPRLRAGLAQDRRVLLAILLGPGVAP